MAASRIAEAYIQVIPRIDGLSGQLTGQLNDEMQSAGESGGQKMATGVNSGLGSKLKSYIGPLAAGFAASFAAAGIAGFLKDAVTGASDFAEQGAAVNQVFGDSSKGIQSFAAGAATSLGQSKTQILEASKQFGIYGQAAGLAGEENATFSKDLVTLATDLASFNNTSVDEALMALGSGLRGEAEPLRKYGVLLDDATLKAKALEMGIYDGNGPLDQQAKIMAANAVIFEQTKTQQGDFARTSDGLANQQRILAANMENVGITIGTALLPIVNTLVTFFNDSLVPAFDAAFGWIRDNIPTIATFGGVLTGLLVIFNAVRIATTLWSVAQGILNAVMALNPITLVAIAVAALIAGIVWLATETTFFQDTWETMTTFVSSAWQTTVDFFETTFNDVAEWFQTYLIDPITDAWETFSGLFDIAVQKLGEFFTPVFNGVTTFFKGIVNGWITIFEKFINFFVRGINGIIAPINDVLAGISTATGGAISLRIGTIPEVRLPRLAKGGFVDSATTAIIGEAGPEVVTPLKDFERMMGLDGSGSRQTINYYAAPNNSINAEQALFAAMRRSKAVTSW